MAAGLMEVYLGTAKGLENHDFFSKIDPYVLIQYKGQERKSSVAREKGSNPSWNEKFTFKVEYPGTGSDYAITLNIMDKDTFSSDDFLGQATVYVEDLLARGVEDGSAELRRSKYRVVNTENSYRGEIEVGVSFKLTEKVEEDQEIGGWRESNY